MTPVINSRIFQDIGLLNSGINTLAPYPKLKKNRKEALIAPSPNIHAKLPKLVETLPSKITVSRYT